MDGPLASYRKRHEAGELKHDNMQLLAIEKLQSLHELLRTYKPSLRKGLGWFSRRREVEQAPNGLYLFGGVGRGKSMMMDLFFEQAPPSEKRRVHFHAFMQEAHAALHRWRNENKVQPGLATPFGADKARQDPMPRVAELVLKDAWLLCFDEFHVNNIADAMILSRLFETLFKRGVVVVATSNWAPDDLYKDGLQRERFLPFIGLWKEKLDIFELSSETDYRLRDLRRTDIYFSPNGEESERALARAFQTLALGEPGEAEKLAIAAGRELTVPNAANGVAWLDFQTICGQSYGAGDYLALAKRYHSLLLSGIPRLGPENRNEARRFMMLIDALYEHRVKFLCSADAPPHALYPAGEGATEFLRTTSRLIEMQSIDYQSQSHQ